MAPKKKATKKLKSKKLPKTVTLQKITYQQ